MQVIIEEKVPELNREFAPNLTAQQGVTAKQCIFNSVIRAALFSPPLDGGSNKNLTTGTASPIQRWGLPSEFNAVQVTVRRTSDGPNGPIDLFFAPIFGRHYSETAATAVAVFNDRFSGYETASPGPRLIPFTEGRSRLRSLCRCRPCAPLQATRAPARRSPPAAANAQAPLSPPLARYR